MDTNQPGGVTVSDPDALRATADEKHEAATSWAWNVVLVADRERWDFAVQAHIAGQLAAEDRIRELLRSRFVEVDERP